LHLGTHLSMYTNMIVLRDLLVLLEFHRSRVVDVGQPPG
jgi:hypothetical protein